MAGLAYLNTEEYVFGQALVLSNLLIAMMNTTYSNIQEKNQQVNA